jgi:hypothetical protein
MAKITPSKEDNGPAGVVGLVISTAYASSGAYLVPSMLLTLSLFISGGLQLAHDVAFFLTLRLVRPPEEIKESAIQGSLA